MNRTSRTQPWAAAATVEEEGGEEDEGEKDEEDEEEDRRRARVAAGSKARSKATPAGVRAVAVRLWPRCQSPRAEHERRARDMPGFLEDGFRTRKGGGWRRDRSKGGNRRASQESRAGKRPRRQTHRERGRIRTKEIPGEWNQDTRNDDETAAHTK